MSYIGLNGPMSDPTLRIAYADRTGGLPWMDFNQKKIFSAVLLKIAVLSSVLRKFACLLIRSNESW